MNRNNFITEFDHPEHNWKWSKLEVHFINNRMQSHIDYTRAVIAERDALKVELNEWRDDVASLNAELAAIKSAPIAGYAHQGTCHYRKHAPDAEGWVALIQKPEGL